MRKTLLIRLRQWHPFLLTVGSALLMFWAVPPERFNGLAWIALAPLLFAITSAATMRQAVACGWLFGTLLAALAIHWLALSIQRYSALPSPLSLSVFALVMGQMGLAWAVFGGLLWRVRQCFPLWPMAALAPVMLAAAEFVVPTLFEWHLGFTQASAPWITQVADFGSVLAVSFLVAMVNGSVFDLAHAAWHRRALPWRTVACTVGVMAFAAGYAQWRIAEIDHARASAETLRIGVVQGNIALAEANDVARANAHLERYLAKSRQLQARGAELILWPETAYPYPLLRHSQDDVTSVDLQRLHHHLDVPLLMGANTTVSMPSEDRRIGYNSAVLIAPDRQHSVAHYDKQLLFPVSEYLPLAGVFPALGNWFPAPRYAAGTQRNLLEWGPLRIGALICLEDLDPSFVRRLAPLRPNLLVTLSSDAQFGADIAPLQHQALAVFRSIEMRLDSVRVSQNGISAIIDAAGRVRVQTRAVDPEALPGVKAFGLTGTVALLDGPRSFYAHYGDVFAWLNLFVAFGVLAAGLLSTRLRAGTPSGSNEVCVARVA
jgi:apolipoprotein N-acyltransferase